MHSLYFKYRDIPFKVELVSMLKNKTICLSLSPATKIKLCERYSSLIFPIMDVYLEKHVSMKILGLCIITTVLF